MLRLPSDILLMICDELGNRRDFQTLVRCAQTSRLIAGHAIRVLYRIDALFPSFDTFDTVPSYVSSEANKANRDRVLRIRLSQWRSIILSSIEKSAYPYCLYIPSLDLRNFDGLLRNVNCIEGLLRSHETKQDRLKRFFAGDMARFLINSQVSFEEQNIQQNSEWPLQVGKIVELVVDTVIAYISDSVTKSRYVVGIRDLSIQLVGIRREALTRWVCQLPELRSITFHDADAIHHDAAKAISAHCPKFEEVNILTCSNKRDLAQFVGGLRHNSLRIFRTPTYGAICGETLLSLSIHAESLRILTLNLSRPDTIINLSSLEDCKSLHTLDIIERWYSEPVNLKESHYNIFLNVVEWLSNCLDLRELSFVGRFNGPAILTQVFAQSKMRLRKLRVESLDLKNNNEFYRFLSRQNLLESLRLDAWTEEAPDQTIIDTLTKSIVCLTKLKTVKLMGVCPAKPAIMHLISKFPKMEELEFDGFRISDDFWEDVKGLSYLRSLRVHATSCFTVDGMLGYVNRLRETNDGFSLFILAQDRTYFVTHDEILAIRRTIEDRVHGTFKFEFKSHRERSWVYEHY